MNFDAVSALATSVLYEGYILYPYGPNALKNRQRWTFGGVFPRDYTETGGGDPCHAQVQCLLQGDPDTAITVRPRFLQIVRRDLGALDPPRAGLPETLDALTPVAALEVDGTRYLAWEEALEQELTPPAWPLAALLSGAVSVSFGIPAQNNREPIRAQDGRVAGALLRSASDLRGVLTVVAERITGSAFRLSVRIENLTPLAPSWRGDRALAQQYSFASLHVLLGAASGEFVSLIDPPSALAEVAAGCDNQGLWPVLVGEAGTRTMMLAAPIILYDYPQIAAESPGDLFDATEIDEILSLRILTMTDAEKRDMAAADPRARALLERTERLGAEGFARLHGTMRSGTLTRRESARRPLPQAGEMDFPIIETARTPLPLAGESLPRTRSGVGSRSEPGEGRFVRGEHVRLKPRRQADIMDIVLRGKVAVIEAVERDFEDRVHLAVTLLDDPGRDLGLERMPGHRFFFAPDEVEKLAS